MRFNPNGASSGPCHFWHENARPRRLRLGRALISAFSVIFLTGAGAGIGIQMIFFNPDPYAVSYEEALSNLDNGRDSGNLSELGQVAYAVRLKDSVMEVADLLGEISLSGDSASDESARLLGRLVERMERILQDVANDGGGASEAAKEALRSIKDQRQ